LGAGAQQLVRSAPETTLAFEIDRRGDVPTQIAHKSRQSSELPQAWQLPDETPRDSLSEVDLRATYVAGVPDESAVREHLRNEAAICGIAWLALLSVVTTRRQYGSGLLSQPPPDLVETGCASRRFLPLDRHVSAPGAPVEIVQQKLWKQTHTETGRSTREHHPIKVRVDVEEAVMLTGAVLHPEVVARTEHAIDLAPRLVCTLDRPRGLTSIGPRGGRHHVARGDESE
jgi:hypothetical protein